MGKVLERAAELEAANAAAVATLPNPTRADGPAALPEELRRRVESVANDRRKLLSIAEQILLARAPSLPSSVRSFNVRTFFTGAELSIADALGWNSETLATECGRAMSIVGHQAVAGTSSDREATRTRAADAAATLAARAPEIENQLAKLRGELAALERDADSARAEQARQENAVAALRSLAPPHVRESLSRAASELDPLRNAIVELRGRLANIETAAKLNVIDGDIRDRAKARLIAEVSYPAALAARAADGVVPSIWLKFVESQQLTVPAVTEQIRTLEAELQSLEAENARGLDLYSR